MSGLTILLKKYAFSVQTIVQHDPRKHHVTHVSLLGFYAKTGFVMSHVQAASSPLKTVTAVIVLIHEKHALKPHLMTAFCAQLV